MSNKKIVIIGGGPAGLTAGYELLGSKKNNVTILEKDKVVGGLSRTLSFKGCKFDIGPHHFVTGVPEIKKWWKNIMGKDNFLHLNRFTRIYYKNHFFQYPLKVLNVLRGLSIFECVRSVSSYFWAQIFPIKKVKSFQDFIINKFGYRLFSVFFKTYSEKLWGISCKEISSDWAAQRIKSFSLGKAVFYAFFGRWFKSSDPSLRTIQSDFHYPEKGAGFLWNKVASRVEQNGGQIFLNNKVAVIEHEDKKIKVVYSKTFDLSSLNTTAGQDRSNSFVSPKLNIHEADDFISSMPLPDLVLSMVPQVPSEILQAAKELKHRDLITVNLIVNKKNVCPDHWLYIHETKVKVIRIGNMNNFSMKMSDDPNHTVLSLEYFTFSDSEFWAKSDKDILEIGKEELRFVGLVEKDEIIDGLVVRCEKAYPVCDMDYKRPLGIVLKYLKQFSNLHLIGRNGLHQYNNMDQAMLSALDAVHKIEDRPQVNNSTCERSCFRL